jgi:integrase
MACLIRSRHGNYSVKWWYRGRQYKASIGQASPTLARRTKAIVEDTISRLKLRLVTIPDDADICTFILTGCVQTQPAQSTASANLRELTDAFLKAHKGQVSTRLTLAIHLRHLCRLLPVARAGEREAEDYAGRRLAEGVRPYTIRKELGTLHQALTWARRVGLVAAAPLWRVADIPIGHDEGREPFRTFDQIAAIIARQKLTSPDAARLWECLYLSSDDVDDCLRHAEKHATAPFVHSMLAIVALTGCRRSEMLRSRPDDWDFTQGVVHIREQKRDTSRKYTTRALDIHPTLRAIVSTWLDSNPDSDYVIK